MKRLVLPVSLLLLAAPAFAQTASVPFVGCPSDGQVGPLPAPTGTAPVLPLAPELAAQLAWYQAKNAPGVLAPRGWHCFSTYGSNGGTLYVTPGPLDPKLLFSTDWKGFAGPAIQISTSNGSTSGRFEVARLIARLFPAHMQFTRDVIAEGFEPAANFPQGPFPHDKLTHRSEDLAEYETPANTEGLGTQSRLRVSPDPITGFVFLSAQPKQDAYTVSLAIRLPPAQSALASAITAGTGHAVLAEAKKPQ